MSYFAWFRRIAQALSYRRQHFKKKRTRFQPQLESLEDRAVPSGSSITQANGEIWMQDSAYKAGFTLKWGGMLTDLSSSGNNIVNNHDDGRGVQTAFYDGSQTYNGSQWGWDPVEGGDEYNHGSTVLAESISTSSFYIKTQANQWNPNAFGGSSKKAVAGDMIVEKWVSFVPNLPNVIQMHYQITYTGTATHTSAFDEFPAVYTATSFNQLSYYGGLNPWTNDAASTYQLSGTNNSTGFLYSSESWESLSNSNNYGLTVFVPGQQTYAWGQYFSGTAGVGGTGTAYFHPLLNFTFTPGKVITGDIYLAVGNVTQNRQTVYSLKNTITFPTHLSDSIGGLSAPSANQTISGVYGVSGWVFDTVTPVTGVQIAVDGTIQGNATYGYPINNIGQYYPNGTVNSAFYYGLNTANLTNGLHTLTMIVNYSDGTSSPFASVPVTVQNTSMAAVGLAMTTSQTVSAINIAAYVQANTHNRINSPTTAGTGNAAPTANNASSASPAIAVAVTTKPSSLSSDLGTNALTSDTLGQIAAGV